VAFLTARLRRRIAFSAAGLLLLTLAAGCAARRRQAGRAGPQPAGVLFQNYCAACHQYDGQGMGDAPPLAGSPWVMGPEDRLIKIVLHGLRGRMELNGKVYDQEMPGFAPVLSDRDVASLVSFVRRSFGAGDEPITAEMVGRIRAAHQHRTEYWTVEELTGGP
jgi:mono/diheme cytochrome c family protein